ncbi:matrix metalloproteinase-19-like isoform X2 [Clavelina lepadiformis]|uniref:matrix metalloproteinase-19-like isoform X2 n=1 Tax=Clavelina lepadiformis TaxID=159417 RepID=UPI00404169A5
MRIFFVAIFIAASARAFPAPEVNSRKIRSADTDLGNLDKYNVATAARSKRSSLLGSFQFGGATRNWTDVGDAISDVADRLVDAMLDSLRGPSESQLSAMLRSESEDVFDLMQDLPAKMTKQTSKVVRRFVILSEEYLGRYGYMSKSRAKSAELDGLIDKSSLSNSIKEFQRMAGIKATGKLNRKTVSMMSMPRCGVEDTMGSFMMGSNGNHANSKFVAKDRRRKRRNRKNKKGKSRSKRYALEGGKWGKTHLKYHIENYTPDLTRAQVRNSIRRALNVWANYTTLRFTYTDNISEADLKISFGTQSHGDPYPFDGKGGTLAHAFFPSDGRAHFDDDEKFDFKDGTGVNLFIVAAHEFGHSLGLSHSSVPNSLMAPFYQGYVPNFTLHPDDIAGIQQLYGKKMKKESEKEKYVPNKPSKPPMSKPTSAPKPGAMKICGPNISFDSMFFNHDSNAMYALKGRYYWKIKDTGVADGYPRKIGKFWEKLPGNIQAAVYSKTTKRTYFFKGSRVWRYDNNRRLERGFPRKVSDLGIPKNLDAAMQWGSDGMMYVFKGDRFYQFSEYSSYDGSVKSPAKKISKFWEGIPLAPDGAIQWKNGKTYFFKGNSYWRYSGMNKETDPNYPRGVKKYWIGCNSQPDPNGRLNTSSTKKPSKSKSPKRSRNRSRRPPVLARLQARPPTNH